MILLIIINLISSLFMSLQSIFYLLYPIFLLLPFDEMQGNEIYQFNLFDRHHQKQENYLIPSKVDFFDVHLYGFLVNIISLYKMYP
jgi:hypothetical protein